MRFLSVLSAVVVAAAAFTFTSDAFAQRGRNQGGAVVVINYERVLAESAIGRDLQAKLNVIAQQVGQEAQALQPEGQSIEQERQRLATATRNMSAEQVRNSSTYAPQFEALAQRLQQFQQRGQSLQADVECTRAIALRDFNSQVTPVVRSVMESRNAAVVLDHNAIQLAAPEYDISTAVIQQLDANAGTRTATVNRQSYTACAPQQQQAPAGQ